MWASGTQVRRRQWWLGGGAVVHALEAVLRERAEEAVLVEAVADVAGGRLEARDVVDDAVPAPRRELILAVLLVLHDERALVHAVAPVVLDPVAGAERDVRAT